MSGYKIVADTNILISAVLAEGIARDFLRQSRKYQVELFGSKWIFQELENVLRKKFHYPEIDIIEIIDTYTSLITIIDVKDKFELKIKDITDIPVLETALSAKADFLVTGDKGLLVLQKVGSTKIVSLRELVDKLTAI